MATKTVDYTCPYCEKEFAPTELRQLAGPARGSFCPKCEKRVRVFWPFGTYVAVLSLVVAVGALVAFRVRSIIGFAIGIVLIWVPLSLYLKLASARYAPPVLRPWTPRSARSQRGKTFFEWLYDRDALRDIFDKRC